MKQRIAPGLIMEGQRIVVHHCVERHNHRIHENDHRGAGTPAAAGTLPQRSRKKRKKCKNIKCICNIDNHRNRKSSGHGQRQARPPFFTHTQKTVDYIVEKQAVREIHHYPQEPIEHCSDKAVVPVKINAHGS